MLWVYPDKNTISENEIQNTVETYTKASVENLLTDAHLLVLDQYVTYVYCLQLRFCITVRKEPIFNEIVVCCALK